MDIVPQMENPSQLQVLIGAPSTLSGCDQTSTLLIEADPNRCRQISQELAGRGLAGRTRIIEAVLGATDGAMGSWYCYSDPRVNGPVKLETWAQVYPNLKLIEELQLGCQSLAALLDSWPEAQHNNAPITLVIRQGDPLAILEGLGAWQERINAIHLTGPGARELWLEMLHTQLQTLGFKRQALESPSWSRAPLPPRLSGLQADQEAINTSLSRYKAALVEIFPKEVYRQKRPDLASYNDEDLVEHFVMHGIHEGSLDGIREIEQNNHRLQQECDELNARLAELEQRASQTATQLDVFRDLFARLVVHQGQAANQSNP